MPRLPAVFRNPPMLQLGRPRVAAGWAIFLAVLWSLLNGFNAVNTALILSHASGYRRATFRINELVYDSGDSDSPTVWWAQGTIDGSGREAFDLRGYLNHRPQDQEDLDSQFVPGQELGVYYNPALPRDLMQGETLRVRPALSTIQQQEKPRLIFLALGVVLPVAIAISLGSRILRSSGATELV